MSLGRIKFVPVSLEIMVRGRNSVPELNVEKTRVSALYLEKKYRRWSCRRNKRGTDHE